MLLYWLQIVKLLPFWVYAMEEEKHEAFSSFRCSAWELMKSCGFQEPFSICSHSLAALTGLRCFVLGTHQVSHQHLESHDQSWRWGKLAALLLLLKLLISTSSAFKLLCSIIGSPAENCKFQKWEESFVVQQVTTWFSWFQECLDPRQASMTARFCQCYQSLQSVPQQSVCNMY